MTRDEAYKILQKHLSKPNLLKHSLAVEGVMRYFAELKGEDVEYWGNVGLLHDVDYEEFPEQHCFKVVDILKSEGIEDDFIKSIQSHGYGLCTEVVPGKFMEKVLITIDQLTGFLTACALVLPSKKVADVQTKSMLKKWKSPNFAAGTERERIEYWTKELGETLEYMLEQTQAGMVRVADNLGL